MTKLELSGNKTAKAVETAELMINAQREELDNVLNEIIHERFGLSNSCFTDQCGVPDGDKCTVAGS